jgi:elongation factor G
MMTDSEFVPIITIAFGPGTAEDLNRVQTELHRIHREYPEIRFNFERHNQFMILSGEDELQLEAISQEAIGSAQIPLGEPKVAFRETIRKTAEAEGKYIRQTGGSGNYGHCWLRIEPNEPEKGYEFLNEIKGGSVPKEYIKLIDEGVRSAMDLGILAGYPLVDIKVTLFDGSCHDVDSNEMAFKFAGSIAFKEAARKAHPVLLEPVTAVEAAVPEEFMGATIDDINSRRGRIESIEHVSGSQVIKAMVPLKEMLRSSPYRRPGYSAKFARYEPVSPRRGMDDDGPPISSLNPRGWKPRDPSSAVRPGDC